MLSVSSKNLLCIQRLLVTLINYTNLGTLLPHLIVHGSVELAVVTGLLGSVRRH